MRQTIIDNGGQKHKGGRIWFTGKTWPDGCSEEWHEDMRFPIRSFPQQNLDQKHTYNIEDINDISKFLGISWQTSKDILFASTTTFIGLEWDLENRMVSLLEKKILKYHNAIAK